VYRKTLTMGLKAHLESCYSIWSNYRRKYQCNVRNLSFWYCILILSGLWA